MRPLPDPVFGLGDVNPERDRLGSRVVDTEVVHERALGGAAFFRDHEAVRGALTGPRPAQADFEHERSSERAARAPTAQYRLSAEKGQPAAFSVFLGLDRPHHPLHLGELFEETVDLLHALPRAARDAALAA